MVLAIDSLEQEAAGMDAMYARVLQEQNLKHRMTIMASLLVQHKQLLGQIRRLRTDFRLAISGLSVALIRNNPTMMAPEREEDKKN